ncbi:LA2681 family HEPN domain-containing protein [Flindersiella endophytica]
MKQENLRAAQQTIIFLDGQTDEDPERVIALTSAVVLEVLGDRFELVSIERAAVLMNASGVLVNAAVRTSDVGVLEVAEDWMSKVVDSQLLRGTAYESTAAYNLANSRIAIADIRWATAWHASNEGNRIVACATARWADRERLRQARHGLDSAARVARTNEAAGMQLCNLANTYDHSGRWIEAYDAYVRALEADPTNGNAAGNAAILISRAIAAGWDFEGHLCLLYDRYVRLAHANRARTVAVAGEHAAQRFDALETLGGAAAETGSHAGSDPYRAWVVRHRLALVAALEGAGTSGGRWDTLTLRSVTTPADVEDSPAIFSILNILKGDFLVARRLAFEAHQVIQDTDCWSQDDSDPGVYTDTLNHAVYGEVASRLVLAHRAALDMLDKTAVAVNEHLKVGDNPKRVSFRKFWFEDDTRTQLRFALMQHTELATAVLSMAELALDMSQGSIYGHAQDVRNAGTHRFVLLHHGLREVSTTPTIQAVTVDAMMETVIQSLTVARASYIYLVAMLTAHETKKPDSTGATLPVYLRDSF